MWLEIAGATYWVAKKLIETATGKAAEGVLDTIGSAIRRMVRRKVISRDLPSGRSPRGSRPRRTISMWS